MLSAVSSQSVNNVFTSAFTNYKLYINAVGSTTLGLNLRLRVSGTDTTTGYNSNSIYGIFTSAAINGNNANNAGYFDATVLQTTNASFAGLTLGDPQTAKRTTYFAQDFGVDYYRITTGQLYNTTQYDGFTIYTSTGNMTGSVSVYGFNI